MLGAVGQFGGIERAMQASSNAAADSSSDILDSPTGQVAEAHSGDLCSFLGIAGAATLVANHRALQLPTMEHLGGRIVLGSMAAAGVDTALQSRNVLMGDEEGGSNPGSIAYAATGLLPATSIAAYKGLRDHPTRADKAGAALLAVNGAVLGFELLTRGPDIVRGDENLSGYGSLLASLGGFVVAHRMVR